MYYVIDTTNDSIVGAVSNLDGYILDPDYIVVEGDFGTDISKLVYDSETNTVRQLTDDELLQKTKEIKLKELKAEIQTAFSNVGDSLADLVKAVKLLMKYCITDDPETKAALKDFLDLQVRIMEAIYPDDYSRSCVANYTDRVVTLLPLYYQAKMQVLNAATIEEVESVELNLVPDDFNPYDME